ncbi:cupin domain-containing protein [Streptomyces celluloflavus]|uniref:cupin domain-containing protein n=1 Tax=Streptomyces celluloflavus TaxID=58344 RepID=UPI00379EA3B1
MSEQTQQRQQTQAREREQRERGTGGRRAPGVGGTAGYVWTAVGDAPVREVFPGIRVRPLWTGGDGAKAQVLEMDPGSCWEGLDVHEPGPEEVFVVAGTFHDGDRDHPSGTFLHAPAGSWHVPQTTEGCTLFVFYPEG